MTKMNEVGLRFKSEVMEIQKQKTTRRWFHDTAYCFDYSALSQWYPERDLNPHSANAEGF